MAGKIWFALLVESCQALSAVLADKSRDEWIS